MLSERVRELLDLMGLGYFGNLLVAKLMLPSLYSYNIKCTYNNKQLCNKVGRG